MRLQYITQAFIARVYADKTDSGTTKQEVYFSELHQEHNPRNILETCSWWTSEILRHDKYSDIQFERSS